MYIAYIMYTPSINSSAFPFLRRHDVKLVDAEKKIIIFTRATAAVTAKSITLYVYTRAYIYII